MALHLLILCVALLPAFAVGAEEAVQLDVALRKSANLLSNISASFYQESPSDDVFLNLSIPSALLNQSNLTFFVSANPINQTCSNFSSVYNPSQVSTLACTSEDCALGDLSGRNASIFVRATTVGAAELLSYRDPDLSLYASPRLQGRSLVVEVNGSVFCGDIGAAPVCSTSEYLTLEETLTSSRTCQQLTSCSRNTEYETTEATATSDRKCTSIVRGDSVVMVIENITKIDFLADEAVFSSKLASDVHNHSAWEPKITRRSSNLVSNYSSSILPSINVTYAMLDPSIPAPVNRTILIRDLEALVQNTSCSAAPNCLSQVLGVTVTQIRLAPPEASIKIITFESPEPPTGRVVASRTDQSIETLANSGKMWRDLLQPLPLPFAAIQYQLQANSNDGSFDMAQAQADAIEWYMPFAVLAAFSLLVVVAVPIFLLFVCCCRCCTCCRKCACCCCAQRCGADVPLPDNDEIEDALLDGFDLIVASRISCTIYSVLLIAMSCCVIAFASVLLASDGRLTEGTVTMRDSVVGFLGNINEFRNQTLSQFEVIPSTLFSSLEENLLELMDNLNADASLQLQDLTRSGYTNIVNTLTSLSNSVEDNYQLALVLDQNRSQIVTLMTNLTDLMSDISPDATAANNACTSEASVRPGGPEQSDLGIICAMIVPIPSGTSFDASSLPSTAPLIAELQEIRDKNLSSSIQDAQTEFDSIPTVADEKVNEAVLQIQSELKKARESIEDGIASLINDTSSLEEEIIKAQDSVMTKMSPENGEETIGMIDSYRSSAVLYISILFIILALLMILGVVMGMCAFNDVTHPSLRGRCSNSGGRMILAALSLQGIFLVVLSLLLFIILLLMPLTGKTCDSFVTQQLYTELLDDPATFDSGYLLGDAVLGDGSVNLTIVSVLDKCGRGDAIWTALQLDRAANNIPNISTFSSLADKVDIAKELSVISLDSVEIIDEDTKSSLRDYSNVNQSSVNLTSFTAPVVLDVSSQLLRIYQYAEGNLTSYHVTYGSSPASLALLQDIQTLIINITEMQSIELNVKARVATLGQGAARLESELEAVPTNVASFLDGVATFETDFDRISSELLDVESVTADVTELSNKFEAIVEDLIRNELGQCQLLSVGYSTVIDTACLDLHHNFDAWWFSMCLISFFILLTIPIGIAVVGNFRRHGKVPDALAERKASKTTTNKRKSQTLRPRPKKASAARELEEHDARYRTNATVLDPIKSHYHYYQDDASLDVIARDAV